MSSAENSDRDAAPQWVDTPTAAALLGVSERAVQRRCKAGKIAARRVPTPTGQQWQIERGALIRASRGADRPDTNDTQSADTNDSNDTLKGEATTLTTPKAPTPTTAPTQGADTHLTTFQLEAARREVDAKAEEIRFLRGLVEQRDRDAAELRAALREALKAMPKQLTAGMPGAAPSAPESPRTTAKHGDEQRQAAPPEPGDADMSEIEDLIFKVFPK